MLTELSHNYCPTLTPFNQMNIVLGITGSIAAYKACTLIRQFVKQGHEVQVVITPAGKEFITPVTLSALTSKPVISDFFAQRDGTWHSHVSLGLWADAMVIAPATASTIGKMAHGIADNMLITTYLSMKAPVFIAPAMDLDMWAHPATQDNLQLLRLRGVTVIEPASGELASHLVGKGRMEEPERIAEVVLAALTKPRDLTGRCILITAGPTYERIDPVRFIGNYSSGKMGIALAEECARRGAQVELVCGPMQLKTTAAGIETTHVESAEQMWQAASQRFPEADAAILCAAVADFTPDTVADQKIKREGDGLVLRLKPTQDIARGLGAMKQPHQRLVGFALETHDEVEHAQAKLQKKNFDFIVLNSLQDEGAGFQHDTNKITIVSATDVKAFPLKPKTEVARDIIAHLVQIL
jgi:phosphopantothenoylcysteine decarboxylase/phosphopantothenate--cysteine ligase